MTEQESEAPKNAPENSPVAGQIFVSYSHEDAKSDWYVDVMRYLQGLNLGETISLWHDSQIEPGDTWATEIETGLKSSISAVFLVSQNFLNSEFIRREEVPDILKRNIDGGLMVHALIGEKCDWEGSWIGDYLKTRQLVHTLDKSLAGMESPERQEQLTKLVQTMRKQIGSYRARNQQQRRVQLIEQIEKHEDLAGLEICREFAEGDTSVVYRALHKSREVAVKALVTRPVSDAGRDEIKAEVSKCQGLRSPVFVRIDQVVFGETFCAVTADWLPGHSLERSLRATGSAPLDVLLKRIRRVLSMVLMMAEALAEAHQKGLRYVSVRPANVLIHQGEPRLYPIDFSSWVASAAHAQGSLSFTMDTLEYLAPEYFVKNAGREEFLKPERDRIKDEFEIAKRAQQYALGMVALAMLEGRPPVKVQALTDIERLLAFQADPRNFSIDGRSRELRNRPWRRAAPGFARVIWRMLEHDPGERWEDMNVVAAQLRLVLNDFTDVPAHVSEAKKIYLCSLRQNKDFYLWVSKRFFRLAPNIKPMFVEVDAKGRQALLDGVLRQLLNYRANQQEPTTLTEIAEQLQKFHLSREHFDLFGQVFVEALIEVENTIPSALDAWEAVLWPGIEYLKRYAGDGASVDKENTH